MCFTIELEKPDRIRCRDACRIVGDRRRSGIVCQPSKYDRVICVCFGELQFRLEQQRLVVGKEKRFISLRKNATVRIRNRTRR